jgi:hypothetical protein
LSHGRYLSSLPLTLEFKQQLLSLRNEPERLQKVVYSMHQLIHQIDVVQEARKKAAGNGDVRREDSNVAGRQQER